MEGALIMFELTQSIFHAKAQRHKGKLKVVSAIQTFVPSALRLCAFA
jgi:hypothetical protein